MFGEIYNGCSANGFAPASIGWVDLQAWSQMTGTTIEPWECEAIMRLNATYVRIQIPKTKK